MLWNLVVTKMKKILKGGQHCILLVDTARYAILYVNLIFGFSWFSFKVKYHHSLDREVTLLTSFY